MAYGYIKDEADRVVKKCRTRDPFAALRALGAIVKQSDRYVELKGYYFHSIRSDFIVINAKLPREEKRIVAAHELAHYILHRDIAKNLPIRDSAMFIVNSRHEYEANLFCSEFLISDDDISEARAACDGDFFNMSRILSVMPELLLFKLHSMNGRGHSFYLPLSLDSSFLKN